MLGGQAPHQNSSLCFQRRSVFELLPCPAVQSRCPFAQVGGLLPVDHGRGRHHRHRPGRCAAVAGSPCTQCMPQRACRAGLPTLAPAGRLCPAGCMASLCALPAPAAEQLPCQRLPGGRLSLHAAVSTAWCGWLPELGSARAEVVGSATALYLLFKIPLWAGVLITVVDVLFILAFGTHNFRVLELVIFLLIATICGCAQGGHQCGSGSS